MMYKNYIVTIIIYIIICVLTLNIAVIKHEQVHYEIQEKFGCINGSIKYGFLTGVTYCHEYMERSEQKKLTEKLAHSQNEIIGYNVQPIILILLILLLDRMLQNINIKKG